MSWAVKKKREKKENALVRLSCGGGDEGDDADDFTPPGTVFLRLNCLYALLRQKVMGLPIMAARPPTDGEYRRRCSAWRGNRCSGAR